MRRRTAILALGGAAGAMASRLLQPLPARAQQSPPAKLPVVGFLSGAESQTDARQQSTFIDALAEAGFAEGRGVIIDSRDTNGHEDLLPTLADALVKRPVAALVAGGIQPALAAKAVTASAAKTLPAPLPVVFVSAADLGGSGLLLESGLPPANMTGVSLASTPAIESERLELLRALAPAAKTIGVLINPRPPVMTGQLAALQVAAQNLGLKVVALPASTASDVEISMARLSGLGVGAVIVSSDPYAPALRRSIVTLAARFKLPTLYGVRSFVDEGGLASYGADLPDAYRSAAGYVARLLKGAKVADLPLLRLSKLQMVLNLGVAKTLGVTVPDAIVQRANETIN